MKRLLIITALILLSMLDKGFAEAPSSNAMANFQKIGYDALKASTIDSIKHDSIGQDESCPAGGTIIMDRIATSQSSMMNITANVTLQTIAAHPSMKPLITQQNKCGDCRQNNRVSYINYVRPVAVTSNNICETYPSELIQVLTQNSAEAEAFTKTTLGGSNSIGKKINANCPSPCAFYIASAQTPTTNGKVQLTMNVQCGPPRSSYFSLTASYTIESGIIHQWTCDKK